MLAYNYQINFSSIKKWLPQTTQKIIYYLENLCVAQQQSAPSSVTITTTTRKTSEHKKEKTDVKTSKKNMSSFDINKTRWELCIKPKNSRGAMQLEKIIDQNQNKTEPDLNEFKRFLEISHMVEIYVKAFFDKIAYRSKSITYLTYKNQHDYIQSKSSSAKKDSFMSQQSEASSNESTLMTHGALSPPLTHHTNLKAIKLEIKPYDLSYLQKNGEERKILEVKSFRFEENDKLFFIGYHYDDDKSNQTFTLYEVNEGERTFKIKYFLDQKTASRINAIEDFQNHEVMGKKIKINPHQIHGLSID